MVSYTVNEINALLKGEIIGDTTQKNRRCRGNNESQGKPITLISNTNTLSGGLIRKLQLHWLMKK
jgi:hypothetical protein